MRRATLMLLALLALALAAPLVGCGGGDDDEPAASSQSAAGAEGGDGAGKNAGTAKGRDGGDGAGGRAPDGDGSPDATGETGAAGSGGEVDLSVDPSSIRRARVTSTGAVQTVPPNEESHQVALENGYSSINNFGEETTGEEATNITFGLVQYLTAKAEGDWATACARLYSVLRTNLERGPDGGESRSCPQAYGELMDRVPRESRVEQAQIDVSTVRRGEGNRAFVIYKTPDTLSADMPMYVEDGIWKVGALEAYVLTPDQVG